MKIRTKSRMHCAQNTATLHINLLDDKTLGFHHCCHKHENCNSLDINEFYKMSDSEFKIFLEETYKILPPNHNYDILPQCKTKNTRCIDNDSYLGNITVNVFEYCNLKCKFCLLTEQKKHLLFNESKKLYFEILNKIKNYGLDTITTTGQGEPFLCKEETINYLRSLSKNVCRKFLIISNMTLLDENDIMELGNIKKNTGLNIRIISSCSGISEKTYSIVHNNNNFNKVINNIKLAYNNDLLDFINFVVQEDNLYELKDFKKFWHLNGILDDSKLMISPVYGEKNKSIINTEEWKLYGQLQ